MQPIDRAALAQRLGQAVEAVADDTIDAFDAGLGKGFSDEVGNVVDPHERCPLLQSETAWAA
ncbi:hypothetical protein [Bradyrhizobium sp. BR 1433]|uniref:hypothetical protein n=1 Tax=Bradyrhizobium sp. BR 1433 TaxID=3447967 RepID=UPI003EE5BD37